MANFKRFICFSIILQIDLYACSYYIVFIVLLTIPGQFSQNIQDFSLTPALWMEQCVS